MPALRDLLEMRTAAPADLSADGSVALVASDLGGTAQLYLQPLAGGGLVQLTDLPEPVSGSVPAGERTGAPADGRRRQRARPALHPRRPAGRDARAARRRAGLLPPHADARAATGASSPTRRTGATASTGTSIVRELGSGEERIVFAEGGWCEVAGFSPDGAVLAVLKATERTATTTSTSSTSATGDSFSAVPHDDDSEVGPPAWLPSGDAFLFATSVGRDTVGIARYELAERRWGYVLEERWDLRCAVDESGQNLLVDWNADGYTRVELRDPETLELLREVPLPGRGVAAAYVFSRDGRRLAYHFTSPLVAGDVWVCDTETGESERLTESPSAVDGGRARRAGAAPLRLVRRRVRARLPLPAVRAGSVPGRDHDPRRPRGPAAARSSARSPSTSSRTGTPSQRRTSAARRATASATSTSTTSASASTRSATSSRCTTGSRRSTGSTSHAPCSTAARTAATWCWPDSPSTPIAGRRGSRSSASPASSRFLENTAVWRRAVREREYGSLEHDREFLLEVSPLTRVDEIRAPLFIIHGANDPRVPVGRGAPDPPLADRARRAVRAERLRRRGPRPEAALEPPRRLPEGGRLPRARARAADPA